MRVHWVPLHHDPPPSPPPSHLQYEEREREREGERERGGGGERERCTIDSYPTDKYIFGTRGYPRPVLLIYTVMPLSDWRI